MKNSISRMLFTLSTLFNFIRTYPLKDLWKKFAKKARKSIIWSIKRPFISLKAKNNRRMIKRSSMKKQVVFVSRQPRIREAKLAYAARSQGWEVILLHEEGVNWDLAEYFDSVKKYKSEAEAISLACGYKPCVYHVFSHVADDVSSVFVKNKPGTVVFDTTDIMEGMVKDPLFQHYKKKQRYCMENADALCARDLQAQYVRQNHGFKLPKKIIYFPEYCWDARNIPGREEKADNGEIHIALAGSFGLEKLNQEDFGYYDIAKRIVSQGVHFHVYPHCHWLYAPKARYEHMFSDFIELSKQTPYFHLHRTVPMDELVAELSRYDAAISVIRSLIYGKVPRTHTLAHYNHCGSARISDYIDAEIPVIINQELKLQCRVLANYGLPVVGSNEVIDDIKRPLMGYRTEAAKEKIRRGKSIYSLHNNAPRLDAFYRDLWDLNQ